MSQDASRLGLKAYSTDRKLFSKETLAGKCEFGRDVAPEVHLAGDGMLIFADGGKVVMRVGAEGLTYVSEEEGRLLLQGVPYSMLDEVCCDYLHRCMYCVWLVVWKSGRCGLVLLVCVLCLL